MASSCPGQVQNPQQAKLEICPNNNTRISDEPKPTQQQQQQPQNNPNIKISQPFNNFQFQPVQHNIFNDYQPFYNYQPYQKTFYQPYFQNNTKPAAKPAQPVLPESFGGTHNFVCYFDSEKVSDFQKSPHHPSFTLQRAPKSAPYTWSTSLRKLFVKMDTPCPVNIRMTSHPPQGSVIKVTPVYRKNEHYGEVVERCPNHREKEQAMQLKADDNDKFKYDPDQCKHMVKSFKNFIFDAKYRRF